MVVQINSTILNRFQEATLEELQEHWRRKDVAGDRGNGRVLMLDDGFSTTARVSQQAGRTGYLYEPLDHGRVTVQSLGSGAYGPFGLHQRLALVNPPVHVGETVMVVYAGDYGDTSLNGQEVTVTAHSGAQLQVRDSTGHHAYIAQWALPADAPRRAYEDVTTQGATRPTFPEKDLTISDWWINRIVSIAKREGRRRHWCSELNEILRDIFRPLAELAPKWTIEQSEDREGWWVVKNQEGVVQATVADRSLIEEMVREKNSQLEAQYVPQITDR